MGKPAIAIFIKLAILAIINAALLTVFIFTEDRPIDGLTSVLLIVPFIVVINLIIALVLYLFKRKATSLLLLLNAILAPVIYNLVSVKHYSYYRHKHYTTYYFTFKQHKFEIELEKDTNFYSFSDITNQGSSSAFIGDYKLKGDSIILLDSTRRPVIIHQKLIGYPTPADTILLTEKR
jgi:hypothetical protein